MKKIIMFLFLLIVLSSFTYAEKITQTFTGDAGIQIEHPFISNLIVNTNHTFHFHLFNISNGYAYKDGDIINCSMHIYNQRLNHIYGEWTDTFENVFDIEFFINSSVFNETGDYSYITQCQDDAGGFVSQTIHVTKNGYPDNKTIFLTLIFGVLGFCFLLLYIAFNLEKVHIFLKVLILFTVIFIQIYLGSVVINLVSKTIYESVGFVFFNAILWFIRLFVIYIFVYFIYSMFQYFEKIPKIKGWKK